MGTCTTKKKTTLNSDHTLHFNIRQFYRFGDILGEGSFGTVRLGYRQYLEKEHLFAIKTINKVQVYDKLYLIRSEFEILRKLDHPNIIRFHEMYEDQMYIYFVVEHCTGGDLLKNIISSGPFNENKCRWIMKRLLSACAYLHKQGIMHRDFKPENILFQNPDTESEIKVIDFGLSKKLKYRLDNTQSGRKNSKVGTPLYIAPEVIKGVYDVKCDEWSLGCIFYILICGDPPFFSENMDALLYKIQNEEVSFNQPEWTHTTIETRKIIKQLLAKDPKKRISAAEVLETDWAKKGIRTDLRLILKNDKQQCEDNHKNTIDNTPINTKNIRALRSYSTSKTFKRETLRILVNQLNQTQLKKLTEKFKELDKDNDGYITYEELHDITNKLGFETTKQELEQLMERIESFTHQSGNMNMNMKIKYTQFLAATIDSRMYLNKERLWSLFRYFDVDNKNYITFEDIKIVLKKTGRQEIDQDKMLKEIQAKSDGKIEFKDFCRLMHDEMDNEQFFEYFEKQYASPLKIK